MKSLLPIVLSNVLESMVRMFSNRALLLQICGSLLRNLKLKKMSRHNGRLYTTFMAFNHF